MVGGDQARLFDRASGILHGHMVLTGPYSKGDRFHPGPAYFYLLAAACAAGGGSLAAATMITSAIKAGTVATLALLTYRLFGWRHIPAIFFPDEISSSRNRLLRL